MHYFNSMFYKRLKAYKHIGYEVINEINQRQKAKTLFDYNNYQDVFEKDLMNANKNITISSPSLSNDKVECFIEIVKPKQEQGLNIRVICSNIDIDDSNTTLNLSYKLNNLGIECITKDEFKSCFAVIDDELIWHGGMNLLGKADYYDNLMRFESKTTIAY